MKNDYESGLEEELELDYWDSLILSMNDDVIKDKEGVLDCV